MKRYSFLLAAFLGPYLLFQQELMAAKMLLPYFGGGSHVWLTSMVYFLGMLFFGYLYTDLISKKLSLGFYRFLHLGLFAVSLISLPFGFEKVHASSYPIVDIVLALLFNITPTFFLLATGTTMLQVWYSRTEHEDRAHPYFLYSSSNWGSLGGLLSYPFLIEYFFTLKEQTTIWTILYLVYGAFLVVCAFQIYPRKLNSIKTKSNIREQANWIVMSGCACALMLTVTNIVATDIGNIPLIWVLPLTIYLITIILNFKKNSWSPKYLNQTGLILIFVIFIYLQFLPQDHSSIVEMIFHYLVLFLICMLCHKDLYDKRPKELSQMTTYYICIALGGWLGSIFTAIIAPGIGRSITNLIWEYSLIIILVLSAKVLFNNRFPSVKKRAILTVIGMAGVLIIAAARFAEKNSLYGLRNFYGRYLITEKDGSRILNHGTTAHGEQFLDENLQDIPLSYYHPHSPIGDVFREFPSIQNVGIVGLGVGALLTYSRRNQKWDIFEIDPDVISLAKDYFTYIERAQTVPQFYVGDGRLQLKKIQDEKYDLLVLDAFSSDSIPLHLLTREAIQLYLSKIKPDGLLAFHISNRFLQLEYPLQNLADSLELTAAHALRRVEIEKQRQSASHWFIMSRNNFLINKMINRYEWRPVNARPGMKSWTDSYSNILSILKI